MRLSGSHHAWRFPSFSWSLATFAPRSIHPMGSTIGGDSPAKLHTAGQSDMSRKTSTIWPNADRHTHHPPYGVPSACQIRRTMRRGPLSAGVHKRTSIVQAQVRVCRPSSQRRGRKYITLPRLCSTLFQSCVHIRHLLTYTRICADTACAHLFPPAL